MTDSRRRSRRAWLLTPGLVLIALFANGRAAAADPIPFTACLTGTPCIDFGNVREPGGTVSYDGAGGPLVGSGIPILSLAGFSTPRHSTPPDLSVPITGGRLNFETGALANVDPLLGYQFSGGGFFTITGAVPDLGLTSTSTVLLDGAFTSASYGFGLPGLPTQFWLGPRGTDLKHEAIMSYFGLPPGAPMTFGGVIVTAPPLGGLGGGAFSVAALNVDVPNQPAPIPEPGTLLLLGSGLLAIGRTAAGRFRTRR
jgi:hypothetical protein